VPFGYLFATALLALATLFALAPLRPHHSSATNKSNWLAFLPNELPFVAFSVLLASTLLALAQGDLATPVGWVGLGLAVLTAAGLVVVVRRARRTRAAIERALREGLGADWRSEIDPKLAGEPRRRLPIGRILFGPFLYRRRDVERVANVSYGIAGKWNLLDVYRHRSHPTGGPMLVYFHGGAFRSGRKNNEARPLIYHLASQGWVCISANYRLSPSARFPDHLIDVKKVIAWVREHGHEYGGDPAVLFAAGSSAGGHLASMAALTPNDPLFQPGFEHADTSVSAAVSLYGFYGSPATDWPRPSSPMAHVSADAPPFFVTHGDLDTVVVVEDARRFVMELRSTSPNPVVYAELPGAHHSFDLFHSIRFEAVVDGIDAFTAWVRSRATT
jgi:acetyl esterase/lipase